MASGTRFGNACFVSPKVCFLSIVFCVLTGCKSDAEKLQQLTADQAMVCLQSEVARKVYMDARYPGGMTRENVTAPLKSPADSLGREYLDRKTECDLATRDLNRFMR